LQKHQRGSCNVLAAILAGAGIMLLVTLTAAQFVASTRWSLKEAAERWEFLMRQLRQ
jgi:hypothetical protein